MNVTETLKAAKALIDTPRKWRRGPSTTHGRCCAINALSEVSEAEPIEAHRVLEEAVPNGSVVSVYNDDPDTAHADIMDLFDRAIAASEAQS